MILIRHKRTLAKLGKEASFIKKRLSILLACLLACFPFFAALVEAGPTTAPIPDPDPAALQTAIEGFFRGEMEKKSEAAQDGWQRFIYQQGPGKITFSLKKFDIAAEKPLTVSFLLASGQPDIKKQPKYDATPDHWLSGVAQSMTELDTSAKINLLVTLENGEYKITYAQGAEASLEGTVEKLAEKALTAFANKTLLSAVVDYFMPTPYLLGNQPSKRSVSHKGNPAFESFLLRNRLGDKSDNGFANSILLMGIKGYKLDVSAGPANAVLTFTVPHLSARIQTAIPNLQKEIAYCENVKDYTEQELNLLLKQYIEDDLIAYRYEDGGGQQEELSFSFLALPGEVNPAAYYTHEPKGFVIDPACYDKEMIDYVATLPDYPAVPLQKNGLIQGESTGEKVTFLAPEDGYDRCLSIYREYDGKLQALVYMPAGKEAAIRLPIGFYSIEVGIGKVWYGTEHRFSDLGAYYQINSVRIRYNSNHTFTFADTFEEALE